MNSILFPGQGSQVVGMGLEFYNNFEIVKKIFKEADDTLNYKISKLILEGPENDLKLTQNTQPAILTVSYSIFSVLKKEFNFNNTKFFAGHSLGEYSALVCADSLKFSDALLLLYERGRSMQEAVPVGEGSMIAILGSNIDEIKNLISKLKINGVCEIANDNAEGQIIISGDVKSINTFQKVLKNNKKKFVSLNVSAPFHCSLMKPAAIKMKDKIKLVNFSKPIFDIVCNVTAQPENNPENIKLVFPPFPKIITSRSLNNKGGGYLINKRTIREVKIDAVKAILEGLTTPEQETVVDTTDQMARFKRLRQLSGD